MNTIIASTFSEIDIFDNDSTNSMNNSNSSTTNYDDNENNKSNTNNMDANDNTIKEPVNKISAYPKANRPILFKTSRDYDSSNVNHNTQHYHNGAIPDCIRKKNSFEIDDSCCSKKRKNFISSQIGIQV